jgi:iron uptake system EfeUOB component EfeO/EfeM
MSLMAITPADKELLKLISRLNNSQKESLINFIKPFLSTDDSSMSETIDQYNLELDQAMQRVKDGKYTSFEELEKEMGSW